MLSSVSLFLCLHVSHYLSSYVFLFFCLCRSCIAFILMLSSVSLFLCLHVSHYLSSYVFLFFYLCRSCIAFILCCRVSPYVFSSFVFMYLTICLHMCSCFSIFVGLVLLSPYAVECLPLPLSSCISLSVFICVLVFLSL